MIFIQMDYYLPVHLSNFFQTTRLFGLQIYGQRMLTIALLINTMVIVLFMAQMNRFTRNWRRSTGLFVGILFQGTGFLLAFVMRDFTGEVIAALVTVLGEMILVPVSQALRADLMEGDQVGTYTGAFSVAQPIAAVLSGVLVSFSSLYGDLGMAFFMVIIMVLAIVPALRSVKLHEAV
jgi:DHA1 family multidrug resistance protein B-like MFS transporter